MEKKEIELHFSTKEPTQEIDCNKILFKKVQIIKGDIDNLRIKFEYFLKNGTLVTKSNKKFVGRKELLIFPKNKTWELKNRFPNYWHDFTEANGKITMTISCCEIIKSNTKELKNKDFQVILFADMLYCQT